MLFFVSLPSEVREHSKNLYKQLRSYKPKRIKRELRRGWGKPAGAVTITRPGRYSNPYRVIQQRDGWHVVISQLRQDELDLGRFDTKSEAIKSSIGRRRK